MIHNQRPREPKTHSKFKKITKKVIATLRGILSKSQPLEKFVSVEAIRSSQQIVIKVVSLSKRKLKELDQVMFQLAQKIAGAKYNPAARVISLA